MSFIATSLKNTEIIENLLSIGVSSYIEGNSIAINRDDMCSCKLSKGLSEEEAYAMVLLFVKEYYDNTTTRVMWGTKNDDSWFLNVYTFQ